MMHVSQSAFGDYPGAGLLPILRSLGRRLRIKYRPTLYEPIPDNMLESLDEFDGRERF